LKYIGPTLERHKGCDILDLNPGAGLWSSKLHDFLQPRSHILLEPAPHEFQKYLDPLLKSPGSTYKLVEGDPRKFDALDAVLKADHFPHQKRVAHNDPRAQEPNNTLLVTGTLMWDPKLPGVGFDSMAKQLLSNFAAMSWKNQAFHAFGPVRMIFWAPNEDFKYLLPKSIHGHGKSSFFAQQRADIKEIVAPSHSDATTNHGMREPRYVLEDMALATKRAKESGFEYPAHRREDMHDFVDNILERTNGTGIVSASECTKFLEEQEMGGKSARGFATDRQLQYWQGQKAFNEAAATESKDTAKKSRSKRVPASKEQKNLSRLRANITSIEKVRAERDRLVEIGDQIYQLECKILDMQDGAQKDAALKELDEMQKEFDDGVSLTNGNWRGAIVTDLDDRISIRSPLPRLMWDARPLEPLMMRSHEAWPSNCCSLVDITPRPLPASLMGDQIDYTHDFISGLLFNATDNVLQALENMQPGASELVKQVESLRDPKRGGRLRLENMRVRMLTVEHVVELSLKYREWPFRAPGTDHPRYFQMRTTKVGKSKWDV
jgi:transcription factor 1